MTIMMVYSWNMASLTEFQIILEHQKTEIKSKKIIQNFVRQAIFLEQTIIFIFQKRTFLALFRHLSKSTFSFSFHLCKNHGTFEALRPKFPRGRLLSFFYMLNDAKWRVIGFKQTLRESKKVYKTSCKRDITVRIDFRLS